jgi:hypothetical protein
MGDNMGAKSKIIRMHRLVEIFILQNKISRAIFWENKITAYYESQLIDIRQGRIECL